MKKDSVWRKKYLEDLLILQPIFPISIDGDFASLEAGNKKIGYENEFFEAVYVWNLPAIVTCPGRSTWCSINCYNADDRPKFNIELWQENWGSFLQNQDELKELIVKELNSHLGFVALRIHSSGDFFSNNYISFWIDIARSVSKKVKIWAYTRSWSVESLQSKLKELERLENVQLFASWDQTMNLPPNNWRVSSINRSPRAKKSIVCPEQTNKVKDCISCRYCITKGTGDVIFESY